MNDLKDALAEIHSIRFQMARSTQFQGYGPASIAFSGALAFVVAGIQSSWVNPGRGNVALALGIWVSAAAVSVTLSSIEMFVRTKRKHSGLAQEMIQSAVEQFLPSLVVGMMLTAVLMWTVPENYWLLPGLWELMFSLGVFASCRFLPRQMFAVGVWYMAAGLCSLVACGASRSFSPWAMGLPFGIGQLLVASVLKFGFEDDSDQT